MNSVAPSGTEKLAKPSVSPSIGSVRSRTSKSCVWMACLVGLWSVLLVDGAPFAKKFFFTQPNDARIELWGEGDDFRSVFETVEGFTVVFDAVAKAYYYARLTADGSDLEASGLQVGKGDPGNLKLAMHLRASAKVVNRR